MFHALRVRRAESLIETLLAITVIVISTTAALSLIRVSVAGNTVIGDKLIALNLGLEAVEAVKNVRDTNYLRFASDPDTCWNTLDVEDVLDCSSATIIEDVSVVPEYYLDRHFNETDPLFEWDLEEVTDSTTHGYLDLYELDLGADIDGDGSDDTIQLYAQTDMTDTVGFTSVEEKAFHRVLEFDYDATGEAFDVTVTVSWLQRGEEKTITLTRTIANVY